MQRKVQKQIKCIRCETCESSCTASINEFVASMYGLSIFSRDFQQFGMQSALKPMQTTLRNTLVVMQFALLIMQFALLIMQLNCLKFS